MKKDQMKNLNVSSLCIHGGNDQGESIPSVKPALYMSNIYSLPTDGTDPDWSGIDSYIYSRNKNVNQAILEEKLALIEGAEKCVVLASGVAALSGLFFTFLSSGDHVVCSQVCYTAVNKMFTTIFPKKFNINVTFVDTTNLEEIKAALRPNTKIIHVETPGNPTTGISDIVEISKISKAANTLLTVDSTFATPLLQSPLKQGADIVMHSMTKYINGHGDSLGGCLLGSKELIDQIKELAMVNIGGVLSPFNCWLIARGLATLPLRVNKHSENAMAVAKYLESNPNVRFVAYPGLESHPQHKLASEQMHGGFSGIICFALKGTAADHYKVLANLHMIVHAVSLGDGESLMVYTSPGSEKMKYYPEVFHDGFYRFSVGLEDAQDIINDLENAFKKVF